MLPPARSYDDPGLWRQLAPRIGEHVAEKTRHLVDGKWKSIEEARELIGYLRALDWIFAAAEDLTQSEDGGF